MAETYRDDVFLTTMSGQKYKRTNFEEDEASIGTSPTTDFNPAVIFKNGVTVFRQRRTTLECLLLLLLAICCLAIIVLSALVAIKDKQMGRNSMKDKQDVCLTPECVTIASSVLNAMDRTADPCKDFFSYACGGWIKAHPIPSGHSRWGTFGVLWQENQVVMKQVIDKPFNSTKSEAERKAMLYYQSCMDKNKTIEDLKEKPLQKLLSQYGGWAISNKSGIWNVSSWNLQKTVEDTKMFGVLFSLWVGEDDKNSSRNILQVDQGGLGLPERDLYLNKSITEDKILSAYLEYMTTVGILLGGEENSTQTQMIEIIEFETKLANITVPSEERRDEEKLYNKKTVRELQTLAPFINWVQLLNKILSVANLTITDKEPIVVYAPDFLKALNVIIQEHMSSDDGKRILNNYLKWQVVKTMTPYLSKPFREARKILVDALKGTTGGEELWRYCVSDTDEVLGFALGAMFVNETFQGESKDKAEKMIDEIKTAFKNNLPNLSWMDKQTRIAAVDKANAVVDMIGFPEYIKNKTKLDQEYSRLVINASDYFGNNIRNMLFELLQNVEQLRKTPKNCVWEMTPPTVNAYYTPSKNAIYFPAGILQAPFYDQFFPKSLNFGAMGVVMGHELTHGFDDQGREYDKEGNLRRWWNNASVEKFEKRTQCIIDQYSQYQLNGENVRGKQTLGENIADNGGLKAAFNAYNDWVSNHGEEPPLPALNLTHRQLFFLGFSQVWCSSSTPEADHLQILSDPHSPAKYRVIGTLSNSEDFARLFHCPKDSPMNPSKKCEVW